MKKVIPSVIQMEFVMKMTGFFRIIDHQMSRMTVLAMNVSQTDPVNSVGLVLTLVIQKILPIKAL